MLRNPEFKRIEEIRATLLSSNKIIPKMDFGAGSKIMPANENEKVSDVCRNASKGIKSCRILYSLIKNQKPQYTLELGTCLGISTVYQAFALKENRTGKLI